MLVPAELMFEPGQTRSSVPVTIKWMAPGRASLRMTTEFVEQPDAGAYSNVTQVLPLVLSSSPGFFYSSQDTSVSSGFQTLQPGNFPVLFSSLRWHFICSLYISFSLLLHIIDRHHVCVDMYTR